MSTRLVMVGGFLGSGKTTLLLSAAELLGRRGYRVGMISNDQGEDLVDTSLAAQQGIPVTEVASGCFCCRFPDLLTALERLEETVEPDIILAEPVGSCTDLVATVLRPLERYRPDIDLAPLTVLLDATRDDSDFSSTLRYLYQQQLSEAQFIVLNKADLLTPAHRDRCLAELAGQRARPLLMSARTSEGLETWLSLVLGQDRDDGEVLHLDYQRYAEAEASLAWLNARGIVHGAGPFSAEAWVTRLLGAMQQGLSRHGSLIAHIKTHVSTPETAFKASLTRSGAAPNWDSRPRVADTEQLEFVLNARICADPQLLEQVALHAIDIAKPQPEARYYLTHFECFRPLPPQPTHRLGEESHRG